MPIGERYKNSSVAKAFEQIQFKHKPWEHQLQATAFYLDGRPKCSMWLPVGSGKTYIPLLCAKFDPIETILVVCPNSVVKGWTEEIEEFSDFRAYSIKGWSVDDIAELICKGAKTKKALVINYEGLLSIFCRRVGVITKTSKEGSKHIPELSKINSVSGLFDMVVIDESHQIKSPTATQTKIIHHIAKRAPRVIEMTGTPIGRSLLDLWSQQFVLDGGKALGTSFWQFRTKYFRQFGFNWSASSQSKKRILEAVDNSVIVFSPEEVHDLPELVYSKREFDLPANIRKIYDDAEADLLFSLEKDQFSINSLPERQMILAEITGGHVKSGGKIVRLAPNAKLTLLGEFLEEELQNEGKIIVFHFFIEEGEIIEEYLRKLKIRSVSIRGGIGDQEKSARENEFRYNPATKVLVANPKSCGVGVNFKDKEQIVANKIVFYSCRYSTIDRQQAEGRIHRQGQKRSCLVVDLVARNTIDEHILSSVRSGMDTVENTKQYFLRRRLSL